MSDWLRQNLPDGYTDALLWVGLALIVLFVVLVIIRLLRGMRRGTFVLGGRNRRTRLAVMDATAVDARRRLVLVRRDDVEHLILIGGPTDLVVEQDIRLVPRPARTADAAAAEMPRAAPSAADIQRAREMTQPPAANQPAERKPAEPPRPVTPPRQSPAPQPAPNVTLPRPQMPMTPPPAPPSPQPGVASRFSAAPARTTGVQPTATHLPPAKEMPDVLLDGIDLSLKEALADQQKRPTPDEEMTRLLGELTKK